MLGRTLGQTAGRAAESVFSRIAKAVKTPAIPETVARGTMENPTVFEKAVAEGVPASERAIDVPFSGAESLRPIVRATQVQETPTIESFIQDLKTTAGSFFRSDPNLPKDIQKTLGTGRWRAEAAKGKADALLRDVYSSLQSNPVKQMATANDYLIVADETAQAVRAGATNTWQGKPLSEWASTFRTLEENVAADPEVAATITKRRVLWDRIFDDMVARGWTVPEHYLEDYTPVRKINGILKGLAAQGGEEFRSRLLNSMMHRTNAQGLRETNMVLLESDILEDYLRKVSEHEMFLDLMADRTVNFTEKFKPGDVVPRGLVAYNPGAGMVGYTVKSPEGQVLNGMVQEMHRMTGLSNTVTPGAYVIPKALGTSLRQYHRRSATTSVESAFIKAGHGLARWLTVYNPANTRLNMASDLLMAMHGLPGEKAHPIGILKMYPMSVGAAYKGAFGKGGTKVRIHGQEVDLWALAESEGLMESTLFHEVQGQKITDELARLLPEAERSSPFVLFDVLQKDRLATELSPRIAAGLEAWKRTGDVKEFGRVGREITFTYGAQGPQASKAPVIRILSPFLQFAGLASGRVFDLLRAPESQKRALASLMATPLVTYMWNTRSPEFREIEDALSTYERDQAHIIVPDPADPTKPLLDVQGKPVVFRFRYMVPEEIMKMAGMGNIASRVDRVVRGRETPGQFVKGVGKKAVENTVNTFTMLPGLISETLETDKDGAQKTLMDRAMRFLPITRPLAVGVDRTRNYGLKEGVTSGSLEAAGIKRASLLRRGKNLSDTDIVTAKVKALDARKALRKALMNEGKVEVERARKIYEERVEELRRLGGVIQEERNEKRGK